MYTWTYAHMYMYVYVYTWSLQNAVLESPRVSLIAPDGSKVALWPLIATSDVMFLPSKPFLSLFGFIPGLGSLKKQ